MPSAWLARGREGTERDRSKILSDFRRELSLVVAKAKSACLLGRVASVGESHRLAAMRRAWVRQEDERSEESSRAHWTFIKKNLMIFGLP